jgi:acid stress-induced BolA-like protein IbaG/YrbA
MESEVRQALVQAGFGDQEIWLEETESGNLGGYVVSRFFEGRSQMDRQEWLWKQLSDRLSPETLHRVVSILTMTPAEIEDDVRAAQSS